MVHASRLGQKSSQNLTNQEEAKQVRRTFSHSICLKRIEKPLNTWPIRGKHWKFRGYFPTWFASGKIYSLAEIERYVSRTLYTIIRSGSRLKITSHSAAERMYQSLKSSLILQRDFMIILGIKNQICTNFRIRHLLELKCILRFSEFREMFSAAFVLCLLLYWFFVCDWINS